MWAKKTYGEDLHQPLTEKQFYAGINYDGLNGLVNRYVHWTDDPEHLQFAKRTYK